jgi:hypothetical protein
MSPIIKSTADVGNDGIKCLVYGRSGVGKSPLLGTAPNPIILSGENGLLSLRRNNPPVPYIEFNTYKQLMDGCKWCFESHEARQFYTIGLDSMTEVMDVLLKEEMKIGNAHGRAYGETAIKGIDLVRAIQNIKGKTIVVLAKEEYEKDNTTGAMMFQPQMPGNQLGQKIPYFFDETFRMLVGKDAQNKDVRYLRTNLSPTEVARDRSGMLNEFEPANLTQVFSKILGF